MNEDQEPVALWRAIAEEAECVVERGVKKLVLTEEMCVRLGTAIENVSAELTALRERVAGMEKDAERYRFLEHQCRTGTYRGIISRDAIDAAMKEPKQ